MPKPSNATQGEAGNGDASQISNTSKNENLPTFTLNLTNLYSLEITEANRNSYTAVIVEWQDIEAGKVKALKHEVEKQPKRL